MPSFWENIRFADESEDVMVSQGMDMATYVSHPAPSEGSSFPAVIVVMEAFGVTRHIEQVCDEYARHGYVAVAPSLYHRDAPNIKLGYDQMPQVQQYMGALQRRGDSLRTSTRPLTTSRTATSAPAATRSASSATASAGASPTWPPPVAPASAPPPSTTAGASWCPSATARPPSSAPAAPPIPVMGNFGEDDANPTPADVAQIEEALKAAGVTYDFKMYSGAGHGFNCNERPDYREDAAADALARTLGWFDQYVKN